MVHANTSRKISRKAKMKKKGNNRSPLFENLYNKKEQVENMLFSLMEKQREGLNPYDSVDEFDQAEKEISTKTYYSLIERKGNELKKIEKLIHRGLNNDDYGYCEECGEKINPKRLMVMPEATLCIDCQRETERPGKTFFSSGSYKGSKWRIESEDDDICDIGIQDNNILIQEMGVLSLAEMEEIDIVGNESGDEDDGDDEDGDDEDSESDN